MFDALHHARGAFGLHAVDLYVGVELLGSVSHATDESAAAHGHDDAVDVRHVVENLQGDGALSGNHQRIVERMHEGHAFFVLELQGAVVGVVVDARHEAYLGAVAASGFHLRDWSTGGQADG